MTAFHAGGWNTLTLGGEYRQEAGRNRTIGVEMEGDRQTFSKHLETTSVFLQDELRLFNRLILSGGWRHDDNTTFGSATTHRASAVLLVNETDTKLRGTWGEGFRAPTINDLFFPGGFGNPSLRPERSESWDAGVDQTLWRKRIRLGATYFENRFRDLIQVLPPTFVPVNVARARTEGVELTADIAVLDTLTFGFNYTHTDSRDLTARQPLRRVAPDRYNFGITWDPTRRLNLFLQAYLVSSEFESVGFPRNPSYHHIDVGGAYRIVTKQGLFPGLDFIVRINNVTDERYMEVFGFQAPGITALAGLRATY